MYRKKNERKTKRHAPGLSRHAAALLQSRRQRFYGTYGQRSKEHKSATRLTEPTPLAIPVAITAEQITEVSTGIYISITLLGKVIMMLHTAGGFVRAVPLDLNPKTIQLLAYLAWKRGTMVKRDKLMEEIWGHGRTEEEATCEKLGWAFDDARKTLREAVRKVVEKMDAEQGEILLDPPLDIFAHRNQMWSLSPFCKVMDLDTVEEQYQIIIEAKKRGMLANTIPEYVKGACDALITAYAGDFLETLIRYHPPDLRTWANAWMREPITYYRDCYLCAIWYAAEYERQAGQCLADERLISDIESRLKQRECWARAAELYKMYAMHACNNRLDTKIYFQLTDRGDGERVIWSERALRECIMLCGELSDPYLIDEAYNAYYNQMRDISDENWEPSEETLRVIQAARERAAAYRLEG